MLHLVSATVNPPIYGEHFPGIRGLQEEDRDFGRSIQHVPQARIFQAPSKENQSGSGDQFIAHHNQCKNQIQCVRQCILMHILNLQIL